jgi:hypothetical protein
MEEFGRAREDWLKTFLRLPGGIPSHDTFNRVFCALNPEELEGCFMDWTRSVADLCKNEVIAIDGKSMCGSRSSGNKSIVHMVSAWGRINQSCASLFLPTECPDGTFKNMKTKSIRMIMQILQ